MTPDERSILTEFLNDLNRFRGAARDREAADLIDRAIRQNPDATYFLVQNAILSNRALQSAAARIRDLEGQLQGGGSQSSFLGGSPPLNRPSGPWGSVPPQSGGYAPSAAQQPAAASGGGGLGSFLGSAATTAAGVAGGALLFEGLSSLFGGRSGGWGWGGGGWGGAPVVNEYVTNVTDARQQADFSSVDQQMDTADDQQDFDLGGSDFSSSDDSI